jgi:hypothetical protein
LKESLGGIVNSDTHNYNAQSGFKGGKMKKNIHQAERLIRIIVGALIASLAFWGPSNYWFLLGLIPMITGLVGWCPLYQMLGISTCPKPKQDAGTAK